MKKRELLAVFFFGILLCFSSVYAQDAPVCTSQLKIYNVLSDFKLLNEVQNAGEIPFIKGSELNFNTKSVSIGELTINSVSPGAYGLAAGFYQKTSPTPLNWIPSGEKVVAVHNIEDVDIIPTSYPTLLYAIGFEMYEPSSSTYCVSACSDTTFQVRLMRDKDVVGTFTFNVPDNARSFVGVSSREPFNRIEIRDQTGTADNEYFLSFYYSKVVSTTSSFSSQCSDTCDNDGDGLIDGLVELNPNNGEIFTVNPIKNPWTVSEAVNTAIDQKKFPYSKPGVENLVRSDGDWTKGTDTSHSPTLTKVCNILGYATAQSHDCHSVYGSSPHDGLHGCNYDSPQNNILFRFNGNNFVSENAAPERGKSWLSSITCKDKLPACSDGWDNDGDGKIDMLDDGCASSNDDDERKHDSDCTDVNDPSEGLAPTCSINIYASRLIDHSPAYTGNQPNPTITVPGGERKVLGYPERYLSLSDVNFDSVGSTPGFVTVGFEKIIVDGPGNDVRIHLNDLIHEPFEVFASMDGVSFVSLGKHTQNGPAGQPIQVDFDLSAGGLSSAQYIKIVNGVVVPTNNANDPVQTNEGPDIDGVEILSCAQCTDTIDNDNDKLFNCADPGCWLTKGDSNSCDPNDNDETLAQCSDGIDNADPEDTLVDFPADPGCTDALDDDETNIVPPQCSDGIDNTDPEDTLVDCLDPGCWEIPGDSASCDPLDNDEVNVGSVTNGYWSNMLGTQATIVDLKDSVKLIATGTGFDTKEITYKIYKKQGTGFLDWFFPDKIIAQSSTQGFLVWKAGQKQSDGIFTGCTGLECYYFTASVSGIGLVTSGILEVRTEENNKRPQVKITQPKDKGIYFKDALITFSAEVTDEDDSLASYFWNVGEFGVTPRTGTLDFKPTGKASITFDYTYLTSGQKNTILTVIDERNAMNKDQASILVVDSINPAKYIFAYIDVPKFGESFGRSVQFDAHSTYSVDVTFPQNTFAIRCVAGFCPDMTTGCPPGQASCAIPVTNRPTCHGLGRNSCGATDVRANYNPITFEWIFDNDVSTTFLGTGNNFVYFSHDFLQSGPHIARLTAKINPESSTQTEFITNFPGTSCVLIENEEDQFSYSTFTGKNLHIRKDSVWITTDVSGNAPQFSVATNDCYRADGFRIDSETRRPIPESVCCASLNPICDSVTKRCVAASYRYCKDISTQTECNGASSVLAKNQIEEETSINLGATSSFGTNNLCTVGYDYHCVWDTDTCRPNYQRNIVYQSNTAGKVWNFDAYNNDAGKRSEINTFCKSLDADIDSQKVSCTLIEDSVVGDCSRGSSYTVSYRFQQIGARPCPPPSTKTVQCPNIPRLTFFTFANVLAVILLLIIVYYLHQRTRAGKKSRKLTKK